MKAYLKQTLRLFSRNRLHFTVNFTGLCLSMISSLIIFHYVSYELSYDRYNVNADNIYRATLQYSKNGKLSFHSAQTYPAVGPQMKQSFPEVKEFARLRSVWAVVSYANETGVKREFLEERIFYADASIFRIFSIKGLSEHAKAQMDKPNTAVVSRTVAKKYFGNEDPVGKVIKLKFSNDFEPYTVEGVFDDIPANTHLKYDILLSYKSFVHYSGPDANQSWTWFGFYTYLLLNPGADAEQLEKKLPGLISKFGNDAPGSHSVLRLQSLKNIHLGSELVDEAETNGSRLNIYFLMLLGLLVVIVAWINYINMTVARTLERTREMGVRKVMGASARQIYGLFIREALIVNLVVFVVSIIVVLLLSPLLESFFETRFVFSFPGTLLLFLSLGVFFTAGAVVSGLYPAFAVLSVDLLNLLKGKSQGAHTLLQPGKVLMLAQYVISLFFITCTLGVYLQMKKMKNHDKGFDVTNVLCMKAPSVNEGNYPYSSRLETFRNEALRMSGVALVAASDNIPGKENENVVGPIRRINAPENQGDAYRTVGVEMDYFSLYRIAFAAGRGFSRDFGADDSTVIINESAARTLGFPDAEHALKSQLTGFNNRTVNIIGVVKDFYQLNEKHHIDPLIFYLKPGKDVLDHRFISIKLDGKNASGVVAGVQRLWNETFPGNPFIYFMAEDFYNEQYKEERQFGRVFGAFSVISVFIALLGLFGLMSLVAIQRKRDIAIHRILGASTIDIGWILSKSFLYAMAAALLIGMALANFAIRRWLNNYTVQLELSFLFYLLPAFVVLVLTFLIISYRVLRVSHSKPIESIRMH